MLRDLKLPEWKNKNKYKNRRGLKAVTGVDGNKNQSTGWKNTSGRAAWDETQEMMKKYWWSVKETCAHACECENEDKNKRGNENGQR